jgi:ferric-dicitrate binding protein FerR (iron transport regulator)
VSFLAKDCARARESVSVQLDGELSDFALDRLETHLRICPECSTWAEQVRDTTQRLREAGLEAPANRFMLPSHRRSWRVSSAVALTSAAAVVATMFFAPAHHGSADSRQGVSQVSGFVGVTGRHFVVSRLSRLEDGVFSPVSAPSTSRDGFRHV